MADKILVYQYMYWDEATRSRLTSSVYATNDVIRNGLGTPIHSSAIEVSRAELRDGGIFVPYTGVTGASGNAACAANDARS